MNFRYLIASSCAVIALAILCMSASSDNSDAGNCGTNTDYTLESGTLTITGTGAINDYDNAYNKAPWHNGVVQHIVIDEGVTKIGNYAFWDLWCVTTVTVADSVTEIGKNSFDGCSALTEVDLSNVTKIGQGAFNGCTKLENLTVSASTDTAVSNSSPAFNGCSSIQNVCFTAGSGSMIAYSDDSSSDSYYGNTPWQISKDKLAEIRFADGITAIDQTAFTGFGFLDTDETSPITPGEAMPGYWFRGTSDAMVKLAHGVTVRSVDSDGKRIAENITEDVAVGSDYSITMPHITGYTPSKETVSGTLAQLSEVYTVKYSVGTYTLTITYKDTGGNQVADTHTSQVKFGGSYSVDSPTITGYAADIATVSGTMDAEGKTVGVTYTGQECTLTVSYYKGYGDPYQVKDIPYNMGESYKIAIEHIAGYVTDSEYLEGTITQTHQYDNVYYRPGTYELTIVHRDKATHAVLRDNVVQNVKYGQAIDYNVPDIVGYNPPAGWVQITMDAEGKTYYLDYTGITFIITVRYVGTDGQDIYLPYVGTIGYGKEYSVDSPVIKGYVPDQSTVSGTAYKNDVITVTYSPASDGGIQEEDDEQDNKGLTIGILAALIVAFSAITIAACVKW